MQGSSLADQKAEPNLTPLLDMVFQLVTFFMLVINFKAADVDRTLSLPVLGSAAPVEEQAQADLLVLNLHADGSLFVRGQKQSSVEGFIELESIRLRNQTKDKQQDGALPVTVVIRGDRALPYQLLDQTLRTCTKFGFERFDFPVIRRAGG